MNQFIEYLEKNNFYIVKENEDAVYKIAKFVEEDKEVEETTKALLLVGASGNGKTTLIQNTMRYVQRNGKKAVFVNGDTIRENIVSYLKSHSCKNNDIYMKEMCNPYIAKDFVVIENIESFLELDHTLKEVLRIIRKLQHNGIRVIIISSQEMKRKLGCEKIYFDEVKIRELSHKSKLEITSKSCEYYGLTLSNNYVAYVSANARRICDIQSILREIRFRINSLGEISESDVIAAAVKKHCKIG